MATQGGIHAVCLTVVFVCHASASPWSSGDFARRSRSFRELCITQQSSERLRLIVEQQRIAETDSVAAETSATDEVARELKAEMAVTLRRIEEFDKLKQRRIVPVPGVAGILLPGRRDRKCRQETRSFPFAY